jgi:hypothetical protein
MDLAMFTDVSVVMAAAVAAVAVGTFLALRSIRKGTQKSIFGRPRRRPAAVKEDVCGICLGPVSKEDMIARCSCGRTFHDTCARPTDSCPYCGCPYNNLTIESPHCVKCPSCGSDVVGNVCKCGAVVSRDGTFVCACGNLLDASDPVCGKCGAEYELRSGNEDDGKV